MGRQLAPLFFAAFLAYGYNNIFMTLTPSFVVAAGGTLAEAGLQNSVYLAAAVLLRFAFGPAADRWGTKPVMLVGLAKASGRPVALVCTSGTALANYYPAVIEAETSRVPRCV